MQKSLSTCENLCPGSHGFVVITQRLPKMFFPVWALSKYQLCSFCFSHAKTCDTGEEFDSTPASEGSVPAAGKQICKAGTALNTVFCIVLADLQKGKLLCFSLGLEHTMSKWMLILLTALEKEGSRRWDCPFSLQCLREALPFLENTYNFQGIFLWYLRSHYAKNDPLSSHISHLRGTNL